MIGTASRLRAMALASAISVGLVGCSLPVTTSVETAFEQVAAARTPATIEGLATEGTLTVGIRNSSVPPLVMEKGAALEGLEIELACALADELGTSVAFRRVVDPKDGLDAGCDVVMDASIESSAYDVVGNDAASGAALFRRGGEGVATVDEIRGKTIALQDGSASQFLLRTCDLGTTEQPCDTLDQAFGKLEAGAVDYVLCHPMSGAYAAQRYGDIHFAGMLNAPSPTGIAVASGNGEVSTAVRDAYDRLQASGVLGETHRRWLGDLPTLNEDARIKDVPMHETSSDAPELSFVAESVGDGSLDGSTAGANAAVISTLDQPPADSGATPVEDWGMNE